MVTGTGKEQFQNGTSLAVEEFGTVPPPKLETLESSWTPLPSSLSRPRPVNIDASLASAPSPPFPPLLPCFRPHRLSPGWQPPQWFLEPSLLSLIQPCHSCQGSHPKERPPCHSLSLKPTGTPPRFATGQSQGSYTRSTLLPSSAPATRWLPAPEAVCAPCSRAWRSSPLSDPGAHAPPLVLRAGVLSLHRHCC